LRIKECIVPQFNWAKLIQHQVFTHWSYEIQKKN
jgi:hypothetical protein